MAKFEGLVDRIKPLLIRYKNKLDINSILCAPPFVYNLLGGIKMAEYGIRIVEEEDEKGYVQIENAMFQDKRISYKAKGILGYLLTKPDGWVVRMADIINHSTDGDKSTRTGIKELRQNGYLKIFRIKRPDGNWWYDLGI